MNAAALIEKIDAVMRDDASIEAIEAGWVLVHRLRSEVDLYWSKDKSVLEAMARLESGLSTFTLHKRQKVPSPYGGFRPSLSLIAWKVRTQFDDNGSPRQP